MHSKLFQPCLFATLWTIAHQSPLSVGFSRQEYWSGLSCSPPGDLPDQGIEPVPLVLPELVGGFFTTNAIWKTQHLHNYHIFHLLLNEVLKYYLDSMNWIKNWFIWGIYFLFGIRWLKQYWHHLMLPNISSNRTNMLMLFKHTQENLKLKISDIYKNNSLIKKKTNTVIQNVPPAVPCVKLFSLKFS